MVERLLWMRLTTEDTSGASATTSWRMFHCLSVLM